MKRIGVIIPAITDNLRTELLDGVFKTASAADCDVIVLFPLFIDKRNDGLHENIYFRQYMFRQPESFCLC